MGVDAEAGGHNLGATDVIRKHLEHPPRTAWRILARNQASALLDLVCEAEDTKHLSASETVQTELIRLGISRAAATMSYSPGRWKAGSHPPSPLKIWEALQDWYAGASVETAWWELHRADERLLLVQNPQWVIDRISNIDAALRSNLKEDDPRLTPATNRLKELGERTQAAPDVAGGTAVPEVAGGTAVPDATVAIAAPFVPVAIAAPSVPVAKAAPQVPDAQAAPVHITLAEREELRGYLMLATTASDEAHANVRSLRNLLIAVGFLTTIALVAVAVLHAVAPGFMDLAVHPPKKGTPDAVEVWEVIVAGAIGGMIAAVFAIAKVGTFSGPYRLPVYQALIRVPAGALVALAAVLLLQSGQITGLTPQSAQALLVVAVIFGYAPDMLLRTMDKTASSLLSQAQNKNDPTRPPLSHPRA